MSNVRPLRSCVEVHAIGGRAFAFAEQSPCCSGLVSPRRRFPCHHRSLGRSSSDELLTIELHAVCSNAAATHGAGIKGLVPPQAQAARPTAGSSPPLCAQALRGRPSVRFAPRLRLLASRESRHTGRVKFLRSLGRTQAANAGKERCARSAQAPNLSFERTSSSWLRQPPAAAQLRR